MKKQDGAGANTRDGANDDTPAYRDTLNQQGAMALARQLEKYWHDQGYPAVRFWAEPIPQRFAKVGTYEIYTVKCNLVNALPPRYRDD